MLRSRLFRWLPVPFPVDWYMDWSSTFSIFFYLKTVVTDDRNLIVVKVKSTLLVYFGMENPPGVLGGGGKKRPNPEAKKILIFFQLQSTVEILFWRRSSIWLSFVWSRLLAYATYYFMKSSRSASSQTTVVIHWISFDKLGWKPLCQVWDWNV